MSRAGDTRAMAPRVPDGDRPGVARYRTAPHRPGLGLRALRGLSGVFTGGLVVLAGTLAVVQWLVSSSGRPGPGAAVLAGHVAAAVLAIAAQVLADRSHGARAALAALVVLVIAALTLWFGWWA